eukprot:7429635-Pyramimonas_sp.AAC.1
MLPPGPDPMFRAMVLPVMTMLRAAWGCWIPKHIVRYGLMHCCAPSWAQVKGPSAAVRLSLERVGWTLLSDECWRTNEGLVVHVFDASPWAVRRLLERA